MSDWNEWLYEGNRSAKALKQRIKKRIRILRHQEQPWSEPDRATVLKWALIKRHVYHCSSCYDAGIKLPAPHVPPPPLPVVTQVLSAFERDAVARMAQYKYLHSEAK